MIWFDPNFILFDQIFEQIAGRHISMVKSKKKSIFFCVSQKQQQEEEEYFRTCKQFLYWTCETLHTRFPFSNLMLSIEMTTMESVSEPTTIWRTLLSYFPRVSFIDFWFVSVSFDCINVYRNRIMTRFAVYDFN